MSRDLDDEMHAGDSPAQGIGCCRGLVRVVMAFDGHSDEGNGTARLLDGPYVEGLWVNPGEGEGHH